MVCVRVVWEYYYSGTLYIFYSLFVNWPGFVGFSIVCLHCQCGYGQHMMIISKLTLQAKWTLQCHVLRVVLDILSAPMHGLIHASLVVCVSLVIHASVARHALIHASLKTYTS